MDIIFADGSFFVSSDASDTIFIIRGNVDLTLPILLLVVFVLLILAGLFYAGVFKFTYH